MFRVYFTNHGYWSDREFDSLSEARSYIVEETGFEATVHVEDRIAAAWSQFRGWRTYLV